MTNEYKNEPAVPQGEHLIYEEGSPGPLYPPQEPVTQGWRFKRNEDGSVGIFAPPPKPGESQRTSHVVYPSQSPDLHELLVKLADQQAAALREKEWK